MPARPTEAATYTPARLADLVRRVWELDPEAVVEVKGDTVRVVPSAQNPVLSGYDAIDMEMK